MRPSSPQVLGGWLTTMTGRSGSMPTAWNFSVSLALSVSSLPQSGMCDRENCRQLTRTAPFTWRNPYRMGFRTSKIVAPSAISCFASAALTIHGNVCVMVIYVLQSQSNLDCRFHEND
jgi:hypothetical protein